MYHTGALLFEGQFLFEVQTGQHSLFTDQDYLFQELIMVILHEKKMQLGMLNPFAEVFIPKNKQNNGNDIKSENRIHIQNNILRNNKNIQLTTVFTESQTEFKPYYNNQMKYENYKEYQTTKNTTINID